MDHAADTLLLITAARRQEEDRYYTCDFFNLESEELRDLRQSCFKATGKKPADAGCRRVMFSWMLRLVSFFHMSQETVVHAMDYLDRYLPTKAGQKALVHRNEFQLTAICCLYISVKIHSSTAVSPKFLEQLSSREYTVTQLEEMELKILQALEWRVQGPTTDFFLQKYLELIPSHLVDNPTLDEVYDLAKDQTEVALGEYCYVTVNKSTIAYAALLNALEALDIDGTWIARYIAEAAHIDYGSDYNQEIQMTLQHDYYLHHSALNGSPSSYGGKTSSASSKEKQRVSCHKTSPRSVTSQAA